MSNPNADPITSLALTLPDDLISTLIERSRGSVHREICGLIATSRPVWHDYPITNNAIRLADRFDMDTVEQIAAFKRIRERHGQLLAIYHSHPVGEAVPSRHDIHGHTYPRAFCVIVAPRARLGRSVRAWAMTNNEPCERAIEPIDAPWGDGFL